MVEIFRGRPVAGRPLAAGNGHRQARSEGPDRRVEAEVGRNSRRSGLQSRRRSQNLRIQGISDEELAEVRRQVDILAFEVERLRSGEPEIEITDDQARSKGLGPAAATIYRKQQGVSIAGYGEMVYNNFSDRNESGDPVSKTSELDFLRPSSTPAIDSTTASSSTRRSRSSMDPQSRRFHVGRVRLSGLPGERPFDPSRRIAPGAHGSGQRAS